VGAKLIKANCPVFIGREKNFQRRFIRLRPFKSRIISGLGFGNWLGTRGWEELAKLRKVWVKRGRLLEETP